MNHLNSQQLAFVLDIKKEDARAKMCVAWAKSKGEENTAERNAKGKVVDSYPQAMPIDLLAEHLNLPTLQQMVDDIKNNYLVRPASKKWILCDYPEKLLLKAKEAGTRPRAKMPAGLKSLLSRPVLNQIQNEWKERHNLA